MRYDEIVTKITQQEGVTESTMMKSPCLRYNGEFMAMMFDKEDALIIKVSPNRVDQLIAESMGMEFNFTKKKFKEWVLIPLEFEDEYESLINESLEYQKEKQRSKN